MDNSQILTIAFGRRAEYARSARGHPDHNSRLSDLRSHMDIRFNDMRDLWRSELYRVEQVIDARLKHLEERG